MNPARALTGNVVYNWFHQPCSYRVHMDLLGDRAERSPFPPAGRFFLERGLRHEHAIFEALKREHEGDVVDVAPDDALDREADIRRRAALTLDAMARGVRYVLHGFLVLPEPLRHRPAGAAADPDDPGLACRGETDILVRIDGTPSRFGPFHYAVGDVKSSQHARFSQKMQVTFYSWILGALQDVVPDHGFIVTGEGRRERFETDETLWTLRHFLEEEVHEFLDADRVFHQFEASCASCHWARHCREKAQREDDIALVPGLRRIDKRALAAAGVRSRADLVACAEDRLRRLGRAWGNRLDGFRDLKRRASAQQFGTPILRQHPRDAAGAVRHGRGARGMAAPDLFSHRGPVILIAAAPDHYDGSEAMIAVELARLSPAGLEPVAGGPSFEPQPRDAGPLHLLGVLVTKMREIEDLLRSRRERALPVFLDGRTRWRVRRAAEGSGNARAVAAAERLISESLGLADVVDRTWYLPEEPRDLHALAALLAGKAGVAAPARAGAPTDEAVAAFLAGRDGLEEAAALERAGNARARLDAILADHGLDPAELAEDPSGRRMVLVRSWRGGEAALEPLLAFDLAEDLAAGRFVLEALARAAAAPARPANAP